LAEVVNGLMMVPNIMVLIHRSSVAVNLTREYENDLRKG
jgi:Na+/alanine symporter